MGYPKAEIAKLVPVMISLHEQGQKINQIAAELKITHDTVSRYLAENGVIDNQRNYSNAQKEETREQEGISDHDIMRIRNSIKVGQRIMCEMEDIDKGSYSTQKTVKVLKNMYVVKKMMNGRGVLVSDNPDDTLGKLVTYVDIIQLRRRLRG